MSRLFTPRRRPANHARMTLQALDDRTAPAFLAPVNYPAGSYPQALVVADFNNDAVPDLAVTGTGSTVRVLLGTGDGTFRPAVVSPTGTYPVALAAGDLNADGRTDLVTANTGGDASVLFGRGDGTFAAVSLAVNPAVADTPSAVAVGDLNGDGAADIAVTSNYLPAYEGGGGGGWYLPEGYLTVFAGDGAGGFAAGQSYNFGYRPTSLRLADLNGDGALDAVAADLGVDVMLGEPGGTFGWYEFYDVGGAVWDVDVGDLDGDGDPDLAVAGDNGIGILVGDGQGYFVQAGTYPDGGGLVAVADFNNDGNLDVATADSVLLGRGDSTFATPINMASPGGRWDLAAADLDGDGWPDLVAISGGNALVYLNDQGWPAADSPSVSIADVTVTEGHAGTVHATFTVTLSAAHGSPVSVEYATADGTATAGSDYQAQSGTLTFGPGETAKTITVAVYGDRAGEPDETVLLNLGPANAFAGDLQGVATIRDDEPRITVSDVTRAEGRRNHTTLFTFTVTLSAASDQPVTVSFRTADGTATTANGDYVAKTGTLTFAPGETTKTVTIEVKGDNKREADETFYLDLSGNSNNSLLLDGRGVGTIVNDD